MLPTKGASLLLLPFWLALLTLFGCGYQFRVQGSGPTIGGTAEPSEKRLHAPRLAILPLQNNTFEPNLELKLANYFRREFSAGAGAEIVNATGAADLLMSGSIMQIELPTLSFDQTRTFESRVQMLVSVQIEDMKTRRTVWAQVAKGTSEFFITQDLQFNRVLQNRALEQAGRFIAEDLASRFLLFMDSGELEKARQRPVSGEPTPGPDSFPGTFQ
ncbi:MAG TPA: LPS assembly lipoprotein LptE [Nitrospiraceae bacterium]|nr:LPS assembly lipoprotein LptE [Nitrospiraceae bacterium]